MVRPHCFLGKSRHYTDLRLRAKRFNLLKALNEITMVEKTALPSDDSMLLFLTYESDIRGMKIHQLQNLINKKNRKIKRLKEKLTKANNDIESIQKYEGSP